MNGPYKAIFIVPFLCFVLKADLCCPLYGKYAIIYDSMSDQPLNFSSYYARIVLVLRRMLYLISELINIRILQQLENDCFYLFEKKAAIFFIKFSL